MAFSPAGLESAEKEACNFPGHVSCFGIDGLCWSGLDQLVLWKAAVLVTEVCPTPAVVVLALVTAPCDSNR